MLSMHKEEAIALLGGTRKKAAEAVGVTAAAISGWPDVLPPRIADRVQAALYRQYMQKLLGRQMTHKEAA